MGGARGERDDSIILRSKPVLGRTGRTYVSGLEHTSEKSLTPFTHDDSTTSFKAVLNTSVNGSINVSIDENSKNKDDVADNKDTIEPEGSLVNQPSFVRRVQPENTVPTPIRSVDWCG